MIDDIGVESENDCEMRRANPWSFPITTTIFQSLNECFQRGLLDSSNTLKIAESVVLVSFPIMSKAWLLMKIWLAYASRITLWILPLQAG
jgi:hypothetical protein